MNVATLFEDTALRMPSALAVVSETGCLTYRELDERARKVAYTLKRLGIGRQEKVAVFAANDRYAVELLLGCMKADVVACFINTRISADELDGLLKTNSFRALVFDESTVERVAAAQADAALIRIAVECADASLVSLDYEALLAESAVDFKTVEACDGNIALQLFTSGTTGAPKAVLHSHQGLAVFLAMFGCAERNCHSPVPPPVRETYLCLLPLYHISGITTLYSLVSGGMAVLKRKFEMDDFLRSIEAHRISRTTVPSTVVEWLAECERLDSYDTSSLVELSYGGCALAQSAIGKIARKLDCAMTGAYGSTESLIVSALTIEDHLVDPESGDMRAYSIGKPLIGAEIAVVDEWGSACPIGVEGEIAVRSPGMMVGYDDRSGQAGGVDASGWLRMGDMGYRDENGYVYLVGRRKDIIISGGENIHPKEIEDCIAQLDDVLNVVVVGVPDKKWGEAPVAFVVRKPGSSMTAERIVEHCEARIAHYKRPREVRFVNELPQDALGKIAKGKLREMVMASNNDMQEK